MKLLIAASIALAIAGCSNTEFGGLAGKKASEKDKDGAEGGDDESNDDQEPSGTDATDEADDAADDDDADSTAPVIEQGDDDVLTTDNEDCVAFPSGNIAARYRDRQKFIDKTDATEPGTVPSKIHHSATFDMGQLKFAAISPSSFAASDYNTKFTNAIPGISLLLNDKESFDITSSTPLHGFGFTFLEPTGTAANATTHDSMFEMRLLKDGQQVGKLIDFNKPEDQVTFVGFWSKEPFDRVEIRDTTATIDNEIFGQFLISTKVLDPADCN